MADGTIARKTGAVSDFGAMLDSIADFIFVIAAFIKILPLVNVPGWLSGWIVIIAMLRVLNAAQGVVRKKKLVLKHTVMNKMTGFLLFLLPLTLPFLELKYSGGVVCVVATVAAVQEGYDIRKERRFCS